MWQLERPVTGPVRLLESHIPQLNRLFADAFTDRYRKDGFVGMRVPQLHEEIWRYALRDAGAGAMGWLDERGDLVAFNVAHHSGVEGWMGPLAVRPDRQGLGLGKAVIGAALEWLRGQQVRVIGLETMPRTTDNIGFYSRLGFVPGYLTVTLTNDVESRSASRASWYRLGEATGGERRAWLARCRRVLHAAMPGYDFTRELELTEELDLGDTVVLGSAEAPSAFALYHSAPLVEGRLADELRVLKLYAASLEAFDDIIAASEAVAARLRLRRVAVRCQTAYREAYRRLIERGYRVRWTDLRMWWRGYEEPMAAAGAVVFSNWEI
jgi:GNAT superfamily N-acetyltransferase